MSVKANHEGVLESDELSDNAWCYCPACDEEYNLPEETVTCPICEKSLLVSI